MSFIFSINTGNVFSSNNNVLENVLPTLLSNQIQMNQGDVVTRAKTSFKISQIFAVNVF